MSNMFVGNKITGNFKPQEALSKNIKDYIVEKYDGVLHLINGNESIALEPLSDNDKLIVNNFSDELGELNESIYQLEKNNGNVILLLYVYSQVNKLLLETQKIRIHLRREVEKEICSEGCNDIVLDSQADIVPFLRDNFINNRSIFVHIDKKNPDAFQMFGTKYRANVKMERPGIYVIDRFYKTYNKEYSFELTQIFGDVDFVLWNDSIGLQGNGQPLQTVQTNEVFKAWDEYMDFEKQVYEDNLSDFGFIKYSRIEVDGEQLIFHLTEPVLEEKVRNIEFEFMSSFDNEDEKELPTKIEEILNIKNTQKNASIFLGTCNTEVFYGDKLVFDIPRYGYFLALNDYKGIIYASDHSLRVEQKRRKKVVIKLDSKSNESANIIMKLSAKDVVDNQLGTTYEPVNSDVLKKMFGNPNVTLKETYREAMSIALNTPDIALIQGPPGTGKTTLIKGVITRINRMNKKYKILVSSEQHEALFNVVDKLSENKFIPPFVSSRRFESDTDEEDNQHFEKNVKEFQHNFMMVCNDILRDIKKRDSKANLVTECVYILQDIRDNKYSKNFISTVIDDLKNKIIALGYYDKMNSDFADLYQCIKAPRNGSVITSFKNLQIINGGQTTASLASAVLKNNTDLSGIYVQMKLSIINEGVDKAELIRLISKYANKQNKVTNADLNSNHPFYTRIEEFSRKIKAPLAPNSTIQSIWFFERARGQYDQSKMKLKTKKERDVYELQNPKAQKFTKTDLAKYINADAMRPYDVSWGAEVNMTKFQLLMEKEWDKNKDQFNEVYYKDLISKAIIFKKIEQLISDEEWYINNKGYRAQLVPYTFSKFMYEISKTGKVFNYKKVWEHHAFSEEYFDDLRKIAKICYDVFNDPHRPYLNIGEYAKRQVCWETIKAKPYSLSEETISLLIDKEDKDVENRLASKEQKFNSAISSEIDIYNRGIDYWKKVKEVGMQLKELNPYECQLCDYAIKFIQQIYRSLSKKQVKDLSAIIDKMSQYIN